MDLYEAQAAARGFTVAVELDSDDYNLVGWVKPNTDYEGAFNMVCGYTGETLRVRGWMFDLVENVELASA